MIAFHNSHDLSYRAPFGAVTCGTPIFLALDLLEAEPGFTCALRTWQDSVGESLIPMECTPLPKGGFRFTGTLQAPASPCLVWYQFHLTAPDGSMLFYGNNAASSGGIGALYQHIPDSYQVTVYDAAPVPEWYKRSVVYQIFPDRFARGADYPDRFFAAQHPDDWTGSPRILHPNWQDEPFYTRNSRNEVTHWDFFGGTLEGIRAKLPYLQNLGISAIYLNPIFSAYSNHRYDTADYQQIDPILGDEEGFKVLAEEARACGIRLILDGVFSHTGADSIYFNRYGNYPVNGACQSEESPYHSWYSFEEYPERYECWWGVKDLPNVDEMQPDYQRYIFGDENSVIRHWLRSGASGWRLDVADELPDAFIKGLRSAIKEENPDAVLMGEVWEDASNKRSYEELREYLLGHELDATMHYPFRKILIDFFLGRLESGEVAAAMMQLKENYPRENYYGALNLVGSHDRARILTLLGGASEDMTEDEQREFRLSPEARAKALARLRALTVLQFTAAGVPCIYYGDEAGMEGGSDPFNRAPFPWGREDAALTDHYRRLISLRNTQEALLSGEFTPLSPLPDLYGCIREAGDEKILAIVSRSSEEIKTRLPVSCGSLHKLFGSGKARRTVSAISLQLPPYGTLILKLE